MRPDRERKARALDALKGNRCSRCRGEFAPAKLHWHHRDPATKVANVGTMRVNGTPLSLALAEAAKCVVLCNPCHRAAHTAGEIIGERKCEDPDCTQSFSVYKRIGRKQRFCNRTCARRQMEKRKYLRRKAEGRI